MDSGVNTLYGPREPVREAGALPIHTRSVREGFARKLPHVAVYVESANEPGRFHLDERLNWTNWTRGGDGADTTARIVTGLDAKDLTVGGNVGLRHFTHLIDQLAPDRRIRVALGLGGSGYRILFQGHALPQTVAWTPQTQTFEVTCLSEGQELLRTRKGCQVLGKFMRRTPLESWVEKQPDVQLVMADVPVFNAGGKPNRSNDAQFFEVGGKRYAICLFTDSRDPEAETWRYVDALRYVCMMHVVRAAEGAPVSVLEFLRDTEAYVGSGSVPNETDPFVRLLLNPVKDVSIQSVNAEEAIAALCDRAGLHYEIVLASNTGASGGTTASFVLKVWATIANNAEHLATDSNTVVRTMGTPGYLDLPREAPFSNQDSRPATAVADANRVTHCTVTLDRRSVNKAVYLGGVKTYEVFLLLRPGWEPHQYLDNLDETEERDEALGFWDDELGVEEIDEDTNLPVSIYHLNNPSFYVVRDVGRLWIFPDDHRYLNPMDPSQSDLARQRWPAYMYSPYQPAEKSLSIYELHDIGAGIGPEAEKWIPRSRPLGPLVSAREGATAREPIVFMHFDFPDILPAEPVLPFGTPPLPTSGWVRYNGAVTIDPTRAAIYFGCENLLLDANLRIDKKTGTYDDNTMLHRIIEQRFAVGVLCTVAGDDRILVEPEVTGSSFSRMRSQVSDLGFETFQFRKRTDRAQLVGVPESDIPEFSTRDDIERMTTNATRDAERKIKDIVAGNPEIFFLDLAYNLGDSFSGCRGLGITFDSAPSIAAIEYTNDPSGGHRTILHLSDLRHAPDVGEE